MQTSQITGVLADYGKYQNSFIGLFTFFFVLEHNYLSIKYWALSKKVDAMIDKTKSNAQISSQVVFWTITGLTAISTATFIYFRSILPETKTVETLIRASESVIIFCSFIVCCIMVEALRRIFLMKGQKLVISVNFLALQFAGFLLFLLSSCIFMYLNAKPPVVSRRMFACYLTEGIIVNLC